MNATDDFYTVRPKDAPAEMEEVRNLLAGNDLELDDQIEVFVVCRRNGDLVACAGLDHYTIKCVAVAEDVRGESLSLELGSEVVQLAAARGQFHLFLYTKPRNLPLFRGWGFYPLVEVPERVVMMENSPVALERYCDGLRVQRRPGKGRRHRPQRQSLHPRPSLSGRAGRSRVRLAARVRCEGRRVDVFLHRSLRARRRGREEHR